jgi:TolB protein
VSDRDNEPGVNNLYLMNADGSNVTRLTSGSEIDYTPAWSPDGTKIAYRSHQDGAGEIYVINADGSNPVNLTNDLAEDWAPAVPDGSLIAFQTDRNGNWEISWCGRMAARCRSSPRIRLTTKCRIEAGTVSAVR